MMRSATRLAKIYYSSHHFTWRTSVICRLLCPNSMAFRNVDAAIFNERHCSQERIVLMEFHR